MKSIIRLFNRAKEWFALLSVFNQLLVVFLFTAVIILFSSVLVGSIKDSYELFIDPSEWPKIEGSYFKSVFTFVLTILGIIITGFIISVLSSFLEGTLRDIKEGNLNYLGKNHILIINYNEKLSKLLEELDIYFEKSQKEVVIFVDDLENLKKLQDSIKELNLNNLKIFIRYGNPYFFNRYEELSIFDVYSVIVLLDENEDKFEADNKNLKIINMLCTYENKKFLNYLKYKQSIDKPVKFVVEFSNVKHFENSIRFISSNLVFPMAPMNVINDVLNLSIIDINFYRIWSELLSFEGYEFFFEPSKNYINKPMKFKELVIGLKNAQIIGISKKVNNEYKLLINEKDEIIDPNNGELGDFIILLRKKDIKPYFEEKQLESPKNIISQPSEIFVRNILILGDSKTLELQEFLNLKTSKIDKFIPKKEELYNKKFFDEILKNIDICILNLDDELSYRVAITLLSFYKTNEILDKFVFLINNPFIDELLKQTGYKNTILSNLLVAKYISQVSNQMALSFVLKELFSKDGSEINFIDKNDIPVSSLSSVEQLKLDLIESEIIYIGIIKKDEKIEFLSNSLEEAQKIIVISKGYIV